MRWNVEGADARTGNERVIQVDAIDRIEAEYKARKQGLLVSAVHESAVKTDAEKLDDLVGEPRNAEPKIDFTPPPVVPYQSRPSHTPIPDYGGLKIARAVLGAFAALYYLLGGLAILAAIFMTVTKESSMGALGAFTVTIYGVICFMGGGILHGLSAACSALRDIARNSFRMIH